MATMEEIERKTKEYADAREKVSLIVTSIKSEIESVHRTHLPRLKRAAATAKDRQATLSALISESPDLFQKPRTVTVHGIKVGFQKQKGKIEWAKDAVESVVARIKKMFPRNWQTYVNVKETPNKTALQDLTVGELRRLGIDAEESGDAVLIKASDSDVDKLVAKLLKEYELDEQEAA